MAGQRTDRNEVFWSLVTWGAALIAAMVVCYLVAFVLGAGAAAGLIFAGVTFIVLAWVLGDFLGGPSASATEAHAAAEAHAVAVPVHHPAPAAPVAPVVVHAPTAPPAVTGGGAALAVEPGTGISERVRAAAKAAGEAARLATGDLAAAPLAGTSSRPVEAVRPAGLGAPRDGGADNLKKIKGVGPKIEELLHGLGFYHFDQIAAWGAAEIAWVDDHLEGFRGRASRDDWVGQSKILAAGGETEFSQRVDKGEVY